MMIQGPENLGIGRVPGSGVSAVAKASLSPAGAPATSFADLLEKGINEVAKLQQDASQAVEDLATGRTENVTGVMTAMEKADLAFKTLLAIRGKLMEAYEEVRNISV